MGADVVSIGIYKRKRADPGPPVLIKRTISVSDLIRECSTAVEVMSPGNPHRLLIINCANVLRGLCDRLAELEPSAGPVDLGRVPVGEGEATDGQP